MWPGNMEKAVSIIIPVKDEEKNLVLLLKGIVHIIPDTWKYEILVIDHNSKDKTPQILQNQQKIIPQLKILTIRNPKIKLGSAFQLAFRKTQYSHIITMDGDLSHPVSFLPQFLTAFEHEQDFIIGGRYNSHQPRFDPITRYYISRLFNYIPRIFTKNPVSDFTSGYRGFQSGLVQNHLFISTDFSFHLELNLFLTLNSKKPAEIPIIYVKRKHGKSKLKYFQQFAGYFKAIFYGMN